WGILECQFWKINNISFWLLPPSLTPLLARRMISLGYKKTLQILTAPENNARNCGTDWPTCNLARYVIASIAVKVFICFLLFLESSNISLDRSSMFLLRVSIPKQIL
ncbi:hypothetical protein L9F63_015087, partial [Diploptera punctata]